MSTRRRTIRPASGSPPGGTFSAGSYGRWVALAALAVAVVVAGWWATRARGISLAPDATQNVLVVTIDALRADALSSYGGATSTPVLDALAARGVRFTFAHANAVTTLPSHVTIFSGQLPSAHGVRTNWDRPLAGHPAFMARRLKEAGFATGAFVGSSLVHRRRGLAEGFDVYDDRVAVPEEPIDLVVGERPGEAVVRSALNWIGQQTGRWFAWVHVFEPHAPYPAGYHVDVAAADAALAPLVAYLAEDARPTLVVVTSDHGEGLGEHAEETHGLFAYETTLRVPLIVTRVGPGAAAPARGVTIDTPVQHLDVLPTVLDGAGLPPDESLPGLPLRQAMAEDGDRPVYFEALSASIRRGWAPLRGVIAGRRKFIDLPIEELYDLRQDPGELRNLAGIDPTGVEAMAAALGTFDLSPPPPSASEEVLERLRSMGYLAAASRERHGDAAADDPKRLVEYDRVMDAGTLAFEDGRFDDAAAALQQVIVERPGNADAYLALAVVFWHGGVPDQAIATLRAALRAGLTQPGIRVTLAQMLARTAGAPRAVMLLEGLTGDDMDALAALGIAYSQVGRDADAERSFRRMLEIEPASSRAFENLGILQLRRGQHAEAEAALRRALAIDPDRASAYTPLGVVLSEQGRVDDAIVAWQQAVQLDPGELLALYNLTVALAAGGRTDEARQAGERFLRTASPSLYADQIAQVRTLVGGG